MKHAIYPEFGEYKLPKKNILVISCMDLRLTDNLVDFLNFDNLQNRYDHFILAGASLLSTKERQNLFIEDVYQMYAHWDLTLQNHIELAKNLHKIEDVYIIEHQDCGAYSAMLDNHKVDLSTLEKEIKCHLLFSRELADRIAATYKLNAHVFFINLRGDVKFLYSKQA